MADRIVVGYFGDRASIASRVRAATARGMDVVAVAFDLGGDVSLRGVRDEALTLGVMRCHALDAREDFAREVVVPALAAAGTDWRRTVGKLAQRFLSESLEAIARLEAATFVEPSGFDLPWSTSVDRRGTHGPATIALRFVKDTPTELNGIPMTPAEILESLETITRLAALDVLAAALQELPGCPGGIVELSVRDGRIDVVSPLVAS